MYKHYITNKLTHKQQIEILLKAKELAFYSWEDMLDCNKSLARITSDKSFDEIIELISIIDYMFSFILRDEEYFGEENYLEIGISTFKSPSYFIWLKLDIKYIEYFLEKYNIGERNEFV